MQRVLAISAMLLLLSACMTDSKEQILATNQSAVQLRSFQTRAFDTTDRVKTLKTVISTLQDLNFVVDKADALLGTVTATKLDRYALRMTVTVRERGTTQTLVRANAQYQVIAVEDPKPYQQFFEALQKAMFLTAHEVDG
jgi:predicted RNA-binding protein with EMAP domain